MMATPKACEGDTMKGRTGIFLSSIVATAFALAGASQAATLTLAYPEAFVIRTLGIRASDGSNPIPGTFYPGIPTRGAVTSGSLTLDWLDAQMQEADMSFSFSMFSPASPLLVSGSWGASNVPVTLRIDELHFESGPVHVVAGWNGLLAPPSATGFLRGSLTVGASTADFEIPADVWWYSDGSPRGLQAFMSESYASLGPGSYYTTAFSALGDFPATDLLTVDGVTFGLTRTYPEFLGILYVPEPGAAALLAVAAGLALARRPGARRLVPRRVRASGARARA